MTEHSPLSQEVKDTYQRLSNLITQGHQGTKKAVLSFDGDGLLCGLLLSQFGWDIAGYYDSSNLLVAPGTALSDCVFFDVEILSNAIVSVGHHIIIYDTNNFPPQLQQELRNCINPNLMRGVGMRPNGVYQYDNKYPFGTINLLLLSLNHSGIPIPYVSSLPFLFADGVYKILTNYAQNVQDWIQYLGGSNEQWWVYGAQNTPLLPVQIDQAYFHNPQLIAHNQGRRKWYSSLKRSLQQPFSFVIANDFLNVSAALLGPNWNYIPNRWATINLSYYNLHRLFVSINDNYDFSFLYNDCGGINKCWG